VRPAVRWVLVAGGARGADTASREAAWPRIRTGNPGSEALAGAA